MPMQVFDDWVQGASSKKRKFQVILEPHSAATARAPQEPSISPPPILHYPPPYQPDAQYNSPYPQQQQQQQYFHPLHQLQHPALSQHQPSQLQTPPSLTPEPQQQQAQPTPDPPPEATPTMQTDGWTQVATKGRKKQQNPRPTKPRNPPSRSITLAKIQGDFNTKMKTWQASECRKTTLATLDRIQPEGGWSIQKAVCIGSGSFSRDNVECARRSMWQFVVFVDLSRELQRRTKGRSDVHMYAQEPEFTDVDRSLLKNYQVTVLEMPEKRREGEAEGEHARDNAAETTTMGTDGLGPAKGQLSKETFLYEPFMDMNEQMVREIMDADPALYIGSSMRGLMAKWGHVGELAKQFDLEHSKYQFPRFEEDPNVLEGLGIYWKEEKDDDEVPQFW